MEVERLTGLKQLEGYKMTAQTPINEQMPQEPMPDERLTKEELERKKLLLEIKDLERPFWKRPAYVLAALPTLLAIAALTVGFINGFFSAQLTKLDNQKHDLAAEIKQFEETRNTLVTQNEKLRQDVLDRESKLTNIREVGARLRGTALEFELHQAEVVRDQKPDAEIQRILKELESIVSDLTDLLKSKTEPY